MTQESGEGPRCAECGRPISRRTTGTLSMSVAALCASCERRA